ncbi:hypothetical protein O3P69_019384 [Scylla paramamosain]|uniref:Uncharacterized protein n=1 Tax=Scylla paramamosain TaxID=85552 RepID=A0AAW0SWH7_SCYPA
MSALPYLMMWLFSLPVGYVADHLQTSGRLSTANTRRLFNSIGIYGPMICLVLVGVRWLQPNSSHHPAVPRRALINGKETVGQWKLVFWIAGIVYLVGNTFYIIFLSGERQPWNDLPAHNSSGLGAPQGAYGTFLGSDEVDTGNERSQGAASHPTKVPEIF